MNVCVKLDWSSHVHFTKTKLWRASHLFKVRQIVPYVVLKMLYHGFVYCCS